MKENSLDNSSWLDNAEPLKPVMATSTAVTNGFVSASGTYVPYTFYNNYKVQLTLTEINKLRDVAKEDVALKKILKKFTGMVELIVDFG